MRLLGNKKLWERTPTHEPFYPEPGTIQSARTVRFNHHIIMHNGKGFYQLPKGQITFVPFLFRRKLFASVIYALLVQKKISSQKKLNCQKKVCVFRDSQIHTDSVVLTRKIRTRYAKFHHEFFLKYRKNNIFWYRKYCKSTRQLFCTIGETWRYNFRYASTERCVLVLPSIYRKWLRDIRL